jgi:NADH:ubiquinone oxidoreductase subunit F (NADH-binding)
LKNAINQAKEKGFLEHFDIDIREGAGAYICGEESALMDSIEGKRGEVRYRPPFPPSRGLWGKPTIINNVETLMNIPQIIFNGAHWFSKLGTEQSKGTKVFSVSGDVKSPGVYELVLGSQLKELVEDLALAKNVKMVQVGGATGRIIPHEMMDTPLTFETILGAGAITVFDESRDVIDIVCRTMEFLAEECCGKCTPGRQGTEAMVEILKRFSRGEGRQKDIRVLEELSSAMMLSSLCGLGQAAPNPVIDSLQHFRSDYDNRIRESEGG